MTLTFLPSTRGRSHRGSGRAAEKEERRRGGGTLLLLLALLPLRVSTVSSPCASSSASASPSQSQSASPFASVSLTLSTLGSASPTSTPCATATLPSALSSLSPSASPSDTSSPSLSGSPSITPLVTPTPFTPVSTETPPHTPPPLPPGKSVEVTPSTNPTHGSSDATSVSLFASPSAQASPLLPPSATGGGISASPSAQGSPPYPPSVTGEPTSASPSAQGSPPYPPSVTGEPIPYPLLSATTGPIPASSSVPPPPPTPSTSPARASAFPLPPTPSPLSTPTPLLTPSTYPSSTATHTPEACPPGAVCPGGGLTCPQPGYWLGGSLVSPIAADGTPSLVQCVGPDAKARCPGVNGTLGCGITNAFDCGPGYTTGSKGCALCAKKYLKQPDGTCTSCPVFSLLESVVLPISLILIAAGAIIALFTAVAITCARAYGGTIVGSLYRSVRFVLWMATAVQMLISIGRQIPISSPAIVQRVFTALASIQFSGGLTGSTSCSGLSPFALTWVGFAIISLVYVLLLAPHAATLVAPLCPKRGTLPPVAAREPPSAVPDADDSPSHGGCCAAVCDRERLSLYWHTATHYGLTLLCLLYATLTLSTVDVLTCAPQTLTVREYTVLSNRDGTALALAVSSGLLSSSNISRRLASGDVASRDAVISGLSAIVNGNSNATHLWFLNASTAEYEEFLSLSFDIFVLVSDPTTVCFEGPHAPVWGAAIFFLAAFAIAFPLVSAVAVALTIDARMGDASIVGEDVSARWAILRGSWIVGRFFPSFALPWLRKMSMAAATEEGGVEDGGEATAGAEEKNKAPRRRSSWRNLLLREETEEHRGGDHLVGAYAIIDATPKAAEDVPLLQPWTEGNTRASAFYFRQLSQLVTLIIALPVILFARSPSLALQTGAIVSTTVVSLAAASFVALASPFPSSVSWKNAAEISIYLVTALSNITVYLASVYKTPIPPIVVDIFSYAVMVSTIALFAFMILRFLLALRESALAEQAVINSKDAWLALMRTRQKALTVRALFDSWQLKEQMASAANAPPAASTGVFNILRDAVTRGRGAATQPQQSTAADAVSARARWGREVVASPTELSYLDVYMRRAEERLLQLEAEAAGEAALLAQIDAQLAIVSEEEERERERERTARTVVDPFHLPNWRDDPSLTIAPRQGGDAPSPPGPTIHPHVSTFLRSLGDRPAELRLLKPLPQLPRLKRPWLHAHRLEASRRHESLQRQIDAQRRKMMLFLNNNSSSSKEGGDPGVPDAELLQMNPLHVLEEKGGEEEPTLPTTPQVPIHHTLKSYLSTFTTPPPVRREAPVPPPPPIPFVARVPSPVGAVPLQGVPSSSSSSSPLPSTVGPVVSGVPVASPARPLPRPHSLNAAYKKRKAALAALAAAENSK